MRFSSAVLVLTSLAGVLATPAPQRNGGDVGAFCGGIAAIKCRDGLTCTLNGKYPDAGGVCTKPTRTTTTKAAPQPTGTFCGGIAAIQCPTGFECAIAATYPDAGGVCIKQKCGGFAGFKCPTGFYCVAPATPDALGYCEAESEPTCGGIAGIKCPSGLTCVAPPYPDATGVCKKL
ncbi:hypothetical protein HK097_007322 [Rhizophlyctis rosea]|uniref:Uncharacterized protein n=1 Tax=Rhizophlyctis rosea TaxID=64517 RepID=A0AAD5SLT7_9FUNG|nr:hypothetical protein HK097_007322 [Rhizophlyctis rosea]